MNEPKLAHETPEEPHPFLKGVKMRTLLSRRDDGADATCFIVSSPAGSEIEEHVHPEQDDIIYVLRTAYGGAHNFHDSNRITFHRVRDFRKLAGGGA